MAPVASSKAVIVILIIDFIATPSVWFRHSGLFRASQARSGSIFHAVQDAAAAMDSAMRRSISSRPRMPDGLLRLGMQVR
jgi:hypothetical protein